MRALQCLLTALALGMGLSAIPGAMAQVMLPPPPPATPNDTLVSPEVSGDTATFRIYAPEARKVALTASFLARGEKLALSRDAEGVWGVTVPKVRPGTFTYAFQVDGVTTLDSRNPASSAAAVTVSSLVRIAPEPRYDDARDVPHGTVTQVHYPSKTFGGRLRRMHVYTPPGYETGRKRYPVLYLLHGGTNSDESWTRVGRANFILDNLIASGAARKMIVVMPYGHAPDYRGGILGSRGDPAHDPFTRDMLDDIMPEVERRFRTAPGSGNRAIAGASMGGMQAHNIGLTNADRFGWVGIFGSGGFPKARAEFEEKFGATLDRDREKFRLIWVAYGDVDTARANSEAMTKTLAAHRLPYRSTMYPGGHNFEKWRDYLHLLAPLLFKPVQ